MLFLTFVAMNNLACDLWFFRYLFTETHAWCYQYLNFIWYTTQNYFLSPFLSKNLLAFIIILNFQKVSSCGKLIEGTKQECLNLLSGMSLSLFMVDRYSFVFSYLMFIPWFPTWRSMIYTHSISQRSGIAANFQTFIGNTEPSQLMMDGAPFSPHIHTKCWQFIVSLVH